MAVEPFLGTRAQKVFIGTSAAQAVVVLVMIGIAFGKIAAHVDFSSSKQEYKTLPCYLALFVLAELFELAMAFDALRQRNVIQLIGILLFHVAMIVFAAIQVHETNSALSSTTSTQGLFPQVEPFLIVVPCIVAAAWCGMIWTVRALYYEFGWAIFRVVGANPAMKKMYQFYQVMLCLLKFDFFCFTGVTIQLLIVVLQSSTAEFGLTIAAIPVVFFLLIGAGIAVTHEVKWLMTISLVLMLAAETYYQYSSPQFYPPFLVVYKLERFFDPSTSAQYVSTRATLTTFTIVAFCILFATFAVGLRCFADFDKGLVRPKTYDAPLFKSRRTSSYNASTPGNKVEDNNIDLDGEPLETRMSIE
ncbi:uncharacterized protein STEHIDRAFT_166278 [Stereum hirsutum FP-91666 SS1]|uniref:uncharacterized protein n=1 Tax=Stereum hirsutum (strain FP-91666) TaxID=721885 RepID=UPI000440A077|nr:uncharacterized protein STEHIDRAFT_166278 [Stereum hirsutum FP-91666 SS1]EIM90009.1 hypothetical protein STEHIDRAFT_166278 [Stereum hirsutum FP-91666 SS1]